MLGIFFGQDTMSTASQTVIYSLAFPHSMQGTYSHTGLRNFRATTIVSQDLISGGCLKDSLTPQRDCEDGCQKLKKEPLWKNGLCSKFKLCFLRWFLSLRETILFLIFSLLLVTAQLFCARENIITNLFYLFFIAQSLKEFARLLIAVEEERRRLVSLAWNMLVNFLFTPQFCNL